MILVLHAADASVARPDVSVNEVVLWKGSVSPANIGPHDLWVDTTDPPLPQGAYEIAVAEGFEGDEAAWLDSLRGADGLDGSDGIDGLDGEPGASSYEVAVDNGFVGDEAAWLASLVGPEGDAGPQGDTGPAGTAAIVGPRSGWVAGEWVSAARTASALAGVGMAVNTLRFTPFRPEFSFTLDRLRLYIAAAASVRLGVYAGDGAAGKPNTLLLDAGATVAGAAGTFTVTTSLAMTAGTLYWLALVSNTAVSVQSHPVASLTPLEPNDPATGSTLTTYSGTLAYGALPSTAPALFKSDVAPAIQMRVA